MLTVPSSAFRKPKDRLALVKSIVSQRAGTSEPEWVEWKLHPDLKPAEARFAVAKFILGAANRDPAKASQYAEGWAYFVLGAEPGNHAGTRSHDSATIQDWLEPYVGGAAGPLWDVHAVLAQGKTVLVFSVNPPAAGVGPVVLHQAFANFHEGSIFIRKLGKTEPANAHDISMLVKRATPISQLGLVVTAVASELKMIDASEPAFQDWRKLEYERIAQEWNNRGRSIGILDKRQDEYVEEVNKYLARADEAFLGRLQRARLKAKGNAVRIAVQNPTDENIRDVVVTIHLPKNWIAAFDCGDIPGPAWPSTPSPQRDILRPTMPYAPELMPRATLPKEPRSIRRGADSLTVAFASFDLRPQSETQREFYAFPASGDDGPRSLLWNATATNIGGVARGEFAVEVDSTPLNWRQLID
jgi:hypothetical protein